MLGTPAPAPAPWPPPTTNRQLTIRRVRTTDVQDQFSLWATAVSNNMRRVRAWLQRVALRGEGAHDDSRVSLFRSHTSNPIDRPHRPHGGRMLISRCCVRPPSLSLTSLSLWALSLCLSVSLLLWRSGALALWRSGALALWRPAPPCPVLSPRPLCSPPPRCTTVRSGRLIVVSDMVHDNVWLVVEQQLA